MASIEPTPDVVFQRTDHAISAPIRPYWTTSGTTLRPTKTTVPGFTTLPTGGCGYLVPDSAYGVMVSIKDIRGLPFVVLEEKGQKKHLIRAPENDAHALPVTSQLNGYAQEQKFHGTHRLSDLYSAAPVLYELSKQITPSPVRRSRPSGREGEFDRSILSTAKARTRSLSPRRAAQERGSDRARSVPPPHRDHFLRQVDCESIEPVNTLIGFFEAGSPASMYSTGLKPSKVDLVDRSAAKTSKIQGVAGKMNDESVVSPRPRSTVSSSDGSSSVNLSRNSQTSSLTVTSANRVAKVGKKPEERYVALGSPGLSTPKGTFTLPRLSIVQKPPDYSTLPTSSVVASSYAATKHGNKLSSTAYNGNQTDPSSNTALVNEEFVVPTRVIRVEQPISLFLSSLTSSSLNPDATNEVTVEPTHISKAKFISPSQMVLKKTRRKRGARKLSTAVSESEYSESEYSDAESLKCGNEARKGEVGNDMLDRDISRITVKAKEVAEREEDDALGQVGHRRRSSIKFDKIASLDVSEKIDSNESDASILKERRRSVRLEQDLKRASDKINRLEKDIEMLNEKLNITENFLEIKNAENNLLKKEVASLKKSLAEAPSDEEKESIMNLQRMLRSSRREKTELEGNIALLKSQKLTLKSRLQDARYEREDGEIQMRALRHEIGKLKGRTNEQERGVEGAKKELERMKRQSEIQIQNLEQQLLKTEEKSKDLKAENSTLENQLDDMKNEGVASASQHVPVNEAMRQLEQSKSTALQELEAAHAEIDEKARALREAERKNSRLQEELRRMDLDVEAELEERESSVEEARQSDQKFRDLNIQNQVVNREVEMLKKELETAKTKATLNENRLDELQNLADIKDSKIDMLVKNNKTLHKQLEDDSITRLDLNRDVTKLDEDNKNLSSEITDLQKRLQETERNLLAGKESLDDAREHFRKVSGDAEKEREKASNLNSDVQECRKGYNRMKSELEKKESALKETEEAIGRAQSQISEYEESCSRAEKEKLMMEDDRDQSRREIKRLKDQIGSQNREIADSNEMMKQLQEKLADDMKSSCEENEKISNLEKELRGLQSTLDKKTKEVFAAEEMIYQQKKVIEELDMVQNSAENRALLEREKFAAETEKQFYVLKKGLTTKDDEIKILEMERKELKEELEELEQQQYQYDNDREKEEELANLSQKLSEQKDERSQIYNKFQAAHMKLGNAMNEVEVERSRVQVLLDEKERHREEISELASSIKGMKKKFKQEAEDLVNIKSHHMKTEEKLRDVLKQAQDETDKAMSEREALAARSEVLEMRVEDAERTAELAEAGKRDMEKELQQLHEANLKLQQTLGALGIGRTTSGSEGSGSLLTSV